MDSTRKHILTFFGFNYTVVGVETDENGYRFSDHPDAAASGLPRELIHIIDDAKLNSVGNDKYALSKGWYDRRRYDDPDIRKLRNGLKEILSEYSKRWE